MLRQLFIACLLFATALPAYATETEIMLRAKANDAKFMGSSIGGVRAVVTDAETGEVLDSGWIRGGTGSTETLMQQPIARGQSLTDDETAGFLAHVDINFPRLLKFTVIGPYGYRQALQEASVTSWVLPGKHILGDGIVLDLSGFIIEAWTSVMEGGIIEFYANASLLCGCKISPNTQWQPDNYEATVTIMRDGQLIKTMPLDFTGPVGIFSGKTILEETGHFKAIISLFDAKTGNVGVVRTIFEMPEQKSKLMPPPPPTVNL